jgi:ParB family chromosome partitioning protein
MAVSKRGLGKGLSNLIPVNEGPEKTETKVVEKIVEKKVIVKEPAETMVKINQIEPNRNQPRTNFDEDALQELADSILQYGVIQPIVVNKKDDYYEIIAGERRWRASKIAGLKEVPVIIKEFSAQEVMEVALIENIQREDLNPIEEALAYQRLINDYNLKQDEIADKVSKSRAAVANSLRLLKLDERVQKMLIDDMISSGHARTLIGIQNGDKQYALAMKVFDEKLSVRDIEKLIKDMGKEPKQKVVKKPQNDFVYRDMEEQLKNIMGTKVVIHNKDNNKGKIEIEYYSQEDFERIMDLIKK